MLLATVSEVVWMSKRMERWITCLIAGLDANVGEETTIKVLEQCGRQCQSESFVKKARDIYQRAKSMDEFLDKLGKVYKHLHKEGDNVYIVYPKCYCSFVNKIPLGQLSAIYCNCSRGWVKALFEGALGRSVEVVMEESIVKGDYQCKFRIIL